MIFWSVYAQFYTAFMSALCETGFNVVSFDPRGHGLSSGPRGDYTIDGIVDNALAVVAYARRRFENPVAVMGSSQGGIFDFMKNRSHMAMTNRVEAVVPDVAAWLKDVIGTLR